MRHIPPVVPKHPKPRHTKAWWERAKKYAHKNHRLDRNATVYNHARWPGRQKHLVTVCGMDVLVRSARAKKVVRRWDATTCNVCRRIAEMPPLVDYSVIEDKDFTPVPDGIYDARLTNWELVPAKSTDKFPFYNCEYTAEEAAGIGKRKFWKVLSISPQSLWAFKKDMLALGADPDLMEPGSEVDTDDIIAAQLEAPCRLALKKEIYAKRTDPPGVKTGERSSIVEVLPVMPF